jgi:uridine kinase
MGINDLTDQETFSQALFAMMKAINPGISDMELYEFRYALENLTPSQGWQSVELDEKEGVINRLNDRHYFDGIQVKPKSNGKIVLDEQLINLTRMLFVGIVIKEYNLEWVNTHFYFDIRGFFFLHRTKYFTEQVLAHFQNNPYKQFQARQVVFNRHQEVGYKEFKEANLEVDSTFIASVKKIIQYRGTPILIAIAGPTAAGKTEIVARLKAELLESNQTVASIELDNYFTDREQREEKGIHSEGRQAYHMGLLIKCLNDLTKGKGTEIPYYDSITAVSSHDLEGKLKPGRQAIQVNPADIIFMEGNFPFILDEVVHLIGLKIVYLTDDEIRLKRKWKRDIDLRKKYEAAYLCNRFFKDQFIMAEIAYLPQLELCDMAVDTTNASLWVTPEIKEILVMENK